MHEHNSYTYYIYISVYYSTLLCTTDIVSYTPYVYSCGLLFEIKNKLQNKSKQLQPLAECTVFHWSPKCNTDTQTTSSRN